MVQPDACTAARDVEQLCVSWAENFPPMQSKASSSAAEDKLVSCKRHDMLACSATLAWHLAMQWTCCHAFGQASCHHEWASSTADSCHWQASVPSSTPLRLCHSVVGKDWSNLLAHAQFWYQSFHAWINLLQALQFKDNGLNVAFAETSVYFMIDSLFQTLSLRQKKRAHLWLEATNMRLSSATLTDTAAIRFAGHLHVHLVRPPHLRFQVS